MTKKLVLAVGTAAVFSILAGCTTYDRAASYVNEPVVSDVKVGMTKQQVRAIAGRRRPPPRWFMRRALATPMRWRRATAKCKRTLSATTTRAMS